MNAPKVTAFSIPLDTPTNAGAAIGSLVSSVLRRAVAHKEGSEWAAGVFLGLLSAIGGMACATFGAENAALLFEATAKVCRNELDQPARTH